MSESEKADNVYVKREGCDVYFYCDVNEESVAELVQTLKKVEIDARLALTKVGLYDQMPRITVHIKSDGGDLYSGLAAMDFMRNMDADVTTYAEGCVASAATFLFFGGSPRIVRRNAYVLFHQIGSEFWGKFEEMKDEMRQCEKLMRHIKKIYLRETEIPEEKLDQMLKRDVYMSYKKCIKYGVSHL